MVRSITTNLLLYHRPWRPQPSAGLEELAKQNSPLNMHTAIGPTSTLFSGCELILVQHWFQSLSPWLSIWRLQKDSKRRFNPRKDSKRRPNPRKDSKMYPKSSTL